MPASSTRPKRKSRVDTYLEEDGSAAKEKENNAPATKKRREEQKAPKTKKQKSTATTDMSDDFGFDFRVRKSTRSTRSTSSTAQTQTTAASSSQAPAAQSLPPPPPKSRVKKPKSQAAPASVPPAEDSRPKGKKRAFDFAENFLQNAATAATTPRIPRPRPTGIPVAGAGNGVADALKVQLPVSDTPIIRKNQEFRKVQGNRRSSVGMRGRRASSLMDNGVIAEPHAEITHEDFYKHIEGSLLEPRRMKQLLAWCGRRALSPPQKLQSNDIEGNAHAMARIIQEELLKDIISRAELSSWFNREDSPATTVVKLPNPRNAENLAKVQECEENLKRLREERETWRSLLQSDTQSSLSLSGGNPDLKIFDKSLLMPAESEFASILENSQDLIGSARGIVKQKGGEIEFQVDQLANGTHKLQQYGEAADRLGTRILEAAESTLSAREARLRQASGTEGLPIQEVLRSLSRMDR